MWTRSLLLMVGLALLISAAAVAAETTTAGVPEERISLELKDVQIRAAIEALFRNTGKNFFIDPQVSGTVPTVSFKDVTFDTALRNLTRSAGLVYRKDGDVYIIAKKPDTTTTVVQDYPAPPVTEYLPDTTSSELRVEKVNLNYSSPSEILAIMRGDYGGGYGDSSGYSRYDGGNYSRGYGSYGGYGDRGGGGYGGGGYGGNVRYGGQSGYGYGGNYSGYGGYGGYSGGYGSYGGGSYRGW